MYSLRSVVTDGEHRPRWMVMAASQGGTCPVTAASQYRRTVSRLLGSEARPGSFPFGSSETFWFRTAGHRLRGAGGVVDKILEKLLAEDEDERGAEEIEHEVEDDIELAVGDKDGFDTESVGSAMNDVLHELPEDTDTGDDADDVRPWIAAATTADGIDDPAEQCRGVGVCKMVPPPDVVVRPEHAKCVGEHRDRRVHPLPRAELEVVAVFENVGERGRGESEAGVDDRAWIPTANPDDEDAHDAGFDTVFDSVCDRRL